MLSSVPKGRNRSGAGNAPGQGDVFRQGPRLLGMTFLLLTFSSAGCASFWEEVMSRERDWSYITGRNKPNPLVVLRDSDDGFRRAQALAELNEPLRHGGDAQQQELYLQILQAAALGGTQQNDPKDEPLCRLKAIRTLGKYQDPRAARILEDVYQQQKMPFTADNNNNIRKEALVALENTRDPDAWKLLIRVARQPGPPNVASQPDILQTQDEKIVAIRALRRYRHQECADALAHVLRTEKDIALRDRALQSLEDITGKQWPAEYAAWQQPDLQRPEPSLAERTNNGFIQQVSGFFKK